MTPSALPEWRPRKTSIDLYNEKSDTPWYYRLGAMVSAMMLAVGIFIFSAALIQSYHSTITPTYSLVSALILVIFAYTMFAVIFIFSKSWIFRLETLCIPHVSSSIVGLISIIYASSINDGGLSAPTLPSRFAVTALVFSVASIVAYSMLAVIIFRKINIVRAMDAYYFSNHGRKYTGLLQEDEERRQQLSRLLLQDEKSTMPPESIQTTFKIDWPGSSKLQSRRSSFSAPKPTFTASKPAFAEMSSHGSRRNQTRRTSHYSPSGIERLPSIRIEEPLLSSSWFATRHSTSTHDSPSNHLTGGIERVPTPLQQEHPRPSGQTPLPGYSGLATLRPLAYVPQSHQTAQYLGLNSPNQPGSPRSALPSYSAYAHASTDISTMPLSLLGEYEFPIDKKEPAIYAAPVPAQQRRIQEGPYRMVEHE